MKEFKIRRTHFPDKILLVPPEIREERLATCQKCSFLKENKCTIIDKFIPTHVQTRAMQCPLGVWTTYYEY